MDQRAIKKRITTQKILQAAKTEFIKNGFLNTTTKTVAESAGVAHGTLFLHYRTKTILMEKVLETQLSSIEIRLNKALNEEEELSSLLMSYLDFLQKEEDFFEVIAKELPYYPSEFRMKVYLKEAVARDYIYESIEKGIDDGLYKDLDIRMALTFLFGTINYFLSNKQNIVKDGSVIEQKKETIVETFLSFIEK